MILNELFNYTIILFYNHFNKILIKIKGDMIMGNIRTSFVKRISKELIETHKGKFTTDFDENKKLVMEYSTVSTKHLRNKIAGYVTRLVRQQKSEY
jgi:small subunit ribosomal protein S17e